MRRTSPHIHFQALDAWRGICALLVAVMHLGAYFLYLPTTGSAVVGRFYLFVDFFFVLSGFVIAHAYMARLSDGEAFLSFAIRRFGRLWPLHAAMFAAMVGLEVAKAVLADDAPAGPPDAPLDGLLNLLLLHALGTVPAPNLNGPSWSISVEFWTNIIFGAVVVLAGRRTLAVLCALFVACSLLLLVASSPPYLHVTTGLGLFRCIYGFAAGVFVHNLWTRRDAPPWTGRLELPVLAAIVAFFLVDQGPPGTMLAPPLFAVGVLVFAHERGPVSRLLKTGPMLRLGLWSYSIYLVHWPLFVLLSRAAGLADGAAGTGLKRTHAVAGETVTLVTLASPAVQVVTAVAVLGLLVMLSALTYRFIEAPGRDFFNALSRRRAPSGGTPRVSRGA